MRKIKVENWKAKDIDGKDVDENILDVLSILVNNKDPKEMPKGLDNFRLMSRISKAFDKAKETKELILEENDYSFLKSSIENDIPSFWGSNPDILKAIDGFLNSKQE